MLITKLDGYDSSPQNPPISPLQAYPSYPLQKKQNQLTKSTTNNSDCVLSGKGKQITFTKTHKMKKTTLFAVLILLTSACFAQNLVRNGSFEMDSCRIWQNQNLHGWFHLNSADYLHMSCQGVANSTFKKPYEGRGCVGLYNGGFGIHFNDTIPTQEYIVGELLEPLIAGAQYHVSFWVKPSSVFDKPSNNMTTDNISLAFIEDTSELRINRIPPFDLIINLEPDVSNQMGIISDIHQYTKIEGCYVADGTENFVVLGNFSPFGETVTVPLSPNTIYNYSYFLIDKIEVVPFRETAIPDDTLICVEEEMTVHFEAWEGYQFYVNEEEVKDSILLSSSGLYQIKTVLGACESEGSFRLETEECTNCRFLVPTAFSPDDNGVNDRINLTSNCRFEVIQAAVYDRWGNAVYESSGDFSWDGRYQNRSLDIGVYAYFIRLQSNGKLSVLSGKISILK